MNCIGYFAWHTKCDGDYKCLLRLSDEELLSQYLCGGSEENHENVDRCGRNSKWMRMEHKAGALSSVHLDMCIEIEPNITYRYPYYGRCFTA
jgi:hypothetical protein